MSEFQFFEVLKSKDIKEADYRKDVKKKLAQEKLYRKIYTDKNIIIKKKDLQNYYDANKNQFVKASSFSVATYQSTQRKSLEKIRKNPMLSVMGVKVKTQTLKSGAINPKLENLLNETKSGEFTPVLNTGKELTMFYIKEKVGVKTLGFDKVKKKLKSVANVKVLRKPNT